jgi:hypothetical protein
MIRSVAHMKKFEIVATDGRLGAVDDFYFDDERFDHPQTRPREV